MEDGEAPRSESGSSTAAKQVRRPKPAPASKVTEYIKTLGYDPYVTWFSVKTEVRPLNPYQLLNLPLMETDNTRVRIAISRCRAQLDAAKDTADPTIWSEVDAEFEEAVNILLDSERKLVLDTALKRDMPRPTAAPRISGVGGVPGIGGFDAIVCRKCQKSNAPGRRFCAGCGAGLFDKCPRCQSEVSANETFCGSCGVNVVETVNSRAEELEEKLRQARLMFREFQFDQATYLLRTVATIEDPRFEAIARRAADAIERLAIERKKIIEKAEAAYVRAKALFEATSYERALEKLESIPESLLTREMTDLMTQVRSRRNELLALGGEIREALADNRRHELLPKLERMLAIKPDHEQAKTLAGDLRDRIISQAKKKLASHSYDEARSMLESIPTFVTTDEVDSLLGVAAELECLADAVRLAPVADEATLGVARKFAKAAGKDETAAQQLAKFEAAFARTPDDPRMAAVDWAPPPRRTQLGVAFDWLGRPIKLGAGPAPEKSQSLGAKLREHPGQLFVAFGLALQAVDEAAISLDLLAREGLINNLMSVFAGRKGKSGWGLDLSDSGLKAVRLGVDSKTGEVHLEGVEVLTHAKPLNHPDLHDERDQVIAATFEEFKRRADLKDCQIVVGLPGLRALARFIELPPMPSGKLAKVAEYEMKAQIPIPLSELKWRWHLIREHQDRKTVDKHPRHIMLLAAKELHTREQFERFNRNGIKPDQMTVDCMALHNAIAHEFMPGPTVDARGKEIPAAPYEGPPVAVVDVGAAASNFVVSRDRASPWFRSFGLGGGDVNERLVRSFQLTHEQAESLKREPAHAKRLHLLTAAINDFHVKCASEIERSMGQFAKLYPTTKIDRIHGTGGGFRAFGLLRYLIHGR